MILIKNGYIKTITNGDIPNCDILLDSGKIVKIGSGITQDSAQIIDATGCIVTPGLVDGHGHEGLHESAVSWEGADYTELTDPVTPQMRSIDGIKPFDENLTQAKSGGVTTSAIGPGSGNAFSGYFSAFKLYGTNPDKMLIAENVAMKCAFGENVKMVYGTNGKMPATRMGIAALIRENLQKTKEYMAEKNEANGDTSKMPPYDIKLEALIPVLERKVPIKAHAHQTDDILTALRIAKEFNVRMTIEHCTDGHLIVQELKEAGVDVFVGPSLGTKSKHELRNKTFKTAGILHNAGIRVSIIVDAPVIPLKYLALHTGYAVKAGLPESAGWEAITINPARVLGVDKRVGSLETGKDADIAVFMGNPLTDIDAKVMYTIIDGEVRYSNVQGEN